MIYLRLIVAYLVIGLFGFGGGYAMLALIEKMVVEPGWITESMFTDIVAVSQMTPGPIGINSATYIGYVAPAVAGIPGWGWGLLGSVVCTLTVVVPSFLLVRYASHWIARHHSSARVQSVMRWLRMVVVGLIASAALVLMNHANFGTSARDVAISVVICACSFAIVRWTRIHPIAVICLAGLAGFVIY